MTKLAIAAMITSSFVLGIGAASLIKTTPRNCPPQKDYSEYRMKRDVLTCSGNYKVKMNSDGTIDEVNCNNGAINQDLMK